MLQAFYNDLGNDEDTFLGHKISDEDSIDDTESELSDEEENEIEDNDAGIYDESVSNNEILPEETAAADNVERNDKNVNSDGTEDITDKAGDTDIVVNE